MFRRLVIVLSIANSAIALPHIFPPNMHYFQWQRWALSVSRSIHGMIEFLGFTASTFAPNSPRMTIFFAISLIGIFSILAADRIWHSGEEGQLIVSFALIFNLMIGGFAVWAGSLLVDSPKECIYEADEVNSLKIIEYRGKGLLPDVHYFLGVSKNEGPEWIQLSLTKREDAVIDPCREIYFLFPDLDELLSEHDTA